MGSKGVLVDAVEFERLVDLAEGSVEADPDAVVDVGRAALALWRGTPMADELQLEPLRAQVVVLKELRVRAQMLVLGARLGLETSYSGRPVEFCAMYARANPAYDAWRVPTPKNSRASSTPPAPRRVDRPAIATGDRRRARGPLGIGRRSR
ncbi:MAG: BTAD domain-containing putative transcriptional regulator [Ilumatobacter sp.]|uniref:BTAD domain-containing putative transcriptional regulator n=1 Tax=Ilumatobacter sp. TaxID=1967498 RepID=UPI00391CC3BC